MIIKLRKFFLLSGLMIALCVAVSAGQPIAVPGVCSGVEADGNSVHYTIYPGADFVFLSPLVDNLDSLDITGSVTGRLGIPLSSSSDFTLGAALLGGVHVGFFDAEFYIQTGMKYDFIRSGEAAGFVFQTGVDYYFTDKIAAGLFYSHWGGVNGGGVSVSVKMGDSAASTGLNERYPEDVGEYAENPALLQFFSLLHTASTGGFYPDSFEEGTEAVRRISVMGSDGESSCLIRASLLDAGINLWGLGYTDQQFSCYYEYVMDTGGRIVKVYQEDDDGDVIEMDTTGSAVPDAEYSGYRDFNSEKQSGISINVEAGKFLTDEYRYTDETGLSVLWWLSGDVPGLLVSYKMETPSGIVVSELIELNRGVKPVLGD